MPLRVFYRNCPPETMTSPLLDHETPRQGPSLLGKEPAQAKDFFINAVRGLASAHKNTFPNFKVSNCRPGNDDSPFNKILGIGFGSGIGILGMAAAWGDLAIADRLANAIIFTKNNADRSSLLDTLFEMLEANPDLLPVLEKLAPMPQLSELNIHNKIIAYQIRSIGARSPMEPGDILKLAALAENPEHPEARKLLETMDFKEIPTRLDPQDPEFVLKTRSLSAAAEHKNLQAIDRLGRLNLADIEQAPHAAPKEKLSLLVQIAKNNGANAHSAFLLLQNAETEKLIESLDDIAEVLVPLLKVGNPSAMEYAHRCTPELLEELAAKSRANTGNERRHALIIAIDVLYPFTGNLKYLELLKSRAGRGDEYAQRLLTQIQSNGKSLAQQEEERDLKSFLEQMPEFRTLVERLDQPSHRTFQYFDLASQGQEEIFESYRWIPRNLRAEYLKRCAGEPLAPGMIPVAYIRAFLDNHRMALLRMDQSKITPVIEVENAGISMLLEKNPEFSQLSPQELEEVAWQLRADWDMLPIGEKTAFQDMDGSTGISPAFVARWMESRRSTGGDSPNSGIRDEETDQKKSSKKGPKGGP